jgi:hypothetical protein
MKKKMLISRLGDAIKDITPSNRAPPSQKIKESKLLKDIEQQQRTYGTIQPSDIEPQDPKPSTITQLTEGVKSISIDMKINRNQLYSSTPAGSNTNSVIVFGKIKDLFTAEMLHKDTGRLFGTTYPQYQYGIKAFSKIYNEKFGFQVGDLTYFMENLNLSIDNNYNLKVSIEYKFLVKKEKL